MAVKTVDATATQRDNSARTEVKIPPDLLSIASGLSARMGCSVNVKSLSVAADRYRLTLEITPGQTVPPRATSMINTLREGKVVLSRSAKNLAVVQGHAKFADHCCAHVRSILKGLSRDYHEIELILTEQSSSSIKAISATGGQNPRRLSD
jgi:hypothetical protein